MTDEILEVATRQAEVEVELAELTEKIKPIQMRLVELEQEKSRIKSRLWILANGVKREDVELTTGDGKPWFGHVTVFMEWLKANGVTRPYAEWNHRIYRTFDLINGRMPENAPGWLEDLTE